MERVADYIIRKIKEAGVSHIYMVTGRGILYLTDAVARDAKMKGVSTYHEQGASYAAMAYASAKGIGACLLSTGCAAANGLAAAVCAYQDNLPVIFVSGNHMLQETTRYTGAAIRTYGSQETDIVAMAAPVTKYAVMLTDKECCVYEVEKALHLAQTGRKGPVWIDVPLDVQNLRIDEAACAHYVPGAAQDTGDGASEGAAQDTGDGASVAAVQDEGDGACVAAAQDGGDGTCVVAASVTAASTDQLSDEIESALGQVAADYRAAKRPLLLIGGGVRDAGAELAALVEQLQLPLAYSPVACDIYGASHSLSVGAVGSIGGSRAGNFAVQNADFILAIGTRLCGQETGMRAAFAREARLVVIDIDAQEHRKDGIFIDRLVVADAGESLRRLSALGLPEAPAAWRERCAHWKEVFAISREDFQERLRERDLLDLYYLAHTLGEAMPEDATIITDAGLEELIVPSAIAYGDGQRCLFPAAQGAMGYAIPAILGAHDAGRCHIVCVVGDGSFMMNMQELQILRSRGIPVKILIINNDMYAVIRKRQRDLFKTRTIGNDPTDGVPAPDYGAIAAAAGFPYRRVEGRRSWEAQLGEILEAEGALVCELLCDPDQVYLHESYALEGKRLVHRPIEDMSPFLPRELVAEEMLVKPWAT